jgi:hypothetical protein
MLMGGMADCLIDQGMDELLLHEAGMCDGLCQYCEEQYSMTKPFDVDQCRERCHLAIRNPEMGKWLHQALLEIERLRAEIIDHENNWSMACRVLCIPQDSSGGKFRDAVKELKN